MLRVLVRAAGSSRAVNDLLVEMPALEPSRPPNRLMLVVGVVIRQISSLRAGSSSYAPTVTAGVIGERRKRQTDC